MRKHRRNHSPARRSASDLPLTRIVVLLAALCGLPAYAAQRTFVSAGSGSDANLCTRLQPCRNFAPAISQTDPGGEVVVLDSGGYGVVSISKSVAVVAPAGVHAAITAFAGNAVTISAATTDVVILRGLSLSGLGGDHGIDFQTGKTLHVEQSTISGFDLLVVDLVIGTGVFVRASGADAYIKDSYARQNRRGIWFESDSTLVRASLDSVRAEENIDGGFNAGPNSLVTVTRSVAAGNFIGFWSTGGVLNVESCTMTMNDIGLYSNNIVRVRNSMITGNGQGVQSSGPGNETISFGNNGLDGNSINGTFTMTIAQQ
jgi:hypothetical protein